MSSKPLDLSQYARRTKVTPQNAPVLVKRMVLAAPADLTEDQKGSLRALVRASVLLDDAKHRKARLDPGKVRPQLDACNATTGGLWSALDAAATLPHSKKAAKAARLRAIIFSDGAPYLQNDAETTYSEARDRLELIRREQLGPELDDVLGPEFLDSAEKTVAALGEAIGVGKTPKVVVSNVEVQEALAGISLAAAVYVRKLLGDVDESDAKSVQRFLSAVAPLDQHRAGMRSRGESDDDVEPVDPTDPTQPQPVGPATPGPFVDEPTS